MPFVQTGTLLSIICAVFMLTLLIQTKHCFQAAANKQYNRLAMEFALEIHLIVQFIIASGSASGRYAFAIVSSSFIVPFSILAVFGIAALAVFIVQCVRFKVFREIPSVLVVAASIPTCFVQIENIWLILLALDALYFFLRAAQFSYLIERAAQTPSLQQLPTAVNKLSAGLMICTKDGDSLYLNDAMRFLLAQKGLLADNSDMRIAMRAFGLDAMKESQAKLDLGDSCYLISSELHTIQGKECFAVSAQDITVQERNNRELAQLNDQLAKQNEMLQANLRMAEETAKAEAVIHMKSRIHDVVGQRLSILHRCLEDDNLSPETIDQMRPILENLISDLNPNLALTPKQEARTVVEAFALTGVTIKLSGNMPDDSSASDLFVRAIREGSTNAVKHAQASLINATLDEDERNWTLSVENDNPRGLIAKRLGTGLSELKQRTESLGGSFETLAGAKFILRLSIPKSDNSDHIAETTE